MKVSRSRWIAVRCQMSINVASPCSRLRIKMIAANNSRLGVFSIVIPCDPGIAYEFARKISSERIFRRRYKMPYMWLMRREHVNSPAEIMSVMKNGFEEKQRTFFPIKMIPIVSANLCVGITYRRL
jgi:hypothetical protein